MGPPPGKKQVGVFEVLTRKATGVLAIKAHYAQINGRVFNTRLGIATSSILKDLSQRRVYFYHILISRNWRLDPLLYCSRRQQATSRPDVPSNDVDQRVQERAEPSPRQEDRSFVNSAGDLNLQIIWLRCTCER